MPGEFFNDPLRLDQLVIHLIAERMTLSPFSDLLIPSVIQTGKMLGRGQLSNFLIQPGQDVLGVSHHRDIDFDILLNARRIDVNVNDLGMPGKFIDLTGRSIVKPGSNRDQQITFSHSIVGIPGPMHSQHTQELRMVTGKPA